MNKSESIKNLASALKKAQSEMGEVKFDSTNPFFKSKYASLGAVIQASKEVLSQNGLVVSQPAITNEYGVGVRTILMHDSGEFIEETVTIPITDQKNIAQEAGKIITYLRRYSLASMLNLYSDEDTDAEKPANKPQPKPVQNAQPKTGALTLEEAMAETGSDGKTYGDCSTEELDKKMIGITKWLNNKDNADSPKLDAYIQKLEAIKLIKAKRG
jgi:hypothetical protein